MCARLAGASPWRRRSRVGERRSGSARPGKRRGPAAGVRPGRPQGSRGLKGVLRDGCERKASFLTEAEWGESVAGKGCEERALSEGRRRTCFGGGPARGRVRGIESAGDRGAGGAASSKPVAAASCSNSPRPLLLTIAVVLLVNSSRAPTTFQRLCHARYVDPLLNSPAALSHFITAGPF